MAAASAQLETATPRGADPSEYKAALVRLRRNQGLYQVYATHANPDERGGLTMYQGGLFRAVVLLPANAPIAITVDGLSSGDSVQIPIG